MDTVSVRLPALLAERLRLEADRRHVAQDKIVQEALELSLPADEGETASQTVAAAASHFIGRFDGPADLATNPRYLEDFGR